MIPRGSYCIQRTLFGLRYEHRPHDFANVVKVERPPLALLRARAYFDGWVLTCGVVALKLF